MTTQADVLTMLDEVLALNGRAQGFSADTPLLGALPELDSMAVVSLVTAIEERFGIAVQDDDISGSTFATVGTLTQYVEEQLAGG